MHFRDVWKRFGTWKAICFALYRIVQKLSTFDISHVMQVDAEKTVISECDDDSFEFGFLSADDVRRFSLDPTNELDALADRIELGFDFCYGAIFQRRLASYCWIALDSVETEHNRAEADPRSGIACSYPADCAFRYKGFTHPDYRGRRLYKHVATRASKAMQTEYGVRFVISTAAWVNFSALRSGYRSGYEYLGHAILFGWGDYILRRGPRHLELRGIYFGDRATVLHRRPLVQPVVGPSRAEELEPVA